MPAVRPLVLVIGKNPEFRRSLARVIAFRSPWTAVQASGSGDLHPWIDEAGAVVCDLDSLVGEPWLDAMTEPDGAMPGRVVFLSGAGDRARALRERGLRCLERNAPEGDLLGALSAVLRPDRPAK